MKGISPKNLKQFPIQKPTEEKIILDNINVSLLSSHQEQLKDILINKHYFKNRPLDNQVFQSDLVIKIQVPSEMYQKRSKKLQMAALINKPTQILINAYNAAFDQLYNDMQNKGDDIEQDPQKKQHKSLRTRNMSSFMGIKPHPPKQNSEKQQAPQIFGLNNLFSYAVKREEQTRIPIQKKQVVFLNELEKQTYFEYNCEEQYSGVLDAFTITYNMLVYELQMNCGFRTRSFIVSRKGPEPEEQQVYCDLDEENKNIDKKNKKYNSKINKQKGKKEEDQETIQQFNCSELKFLKYSTENAKRYIYILLYTPIDNLLKAANNYQLKKQFDYAQIDPYLNQPLDSNNRPLRYHSSITGYLEDDGARSSSIYRFKQQQAACVTSRQLTERKKIERKFNFLIPWGKQSFQNMVNQVELKKQDLQKYKSYTDQLIEKANQIIKTFKEYSSDESQEQDLMGRLQIPPSQFNGQSKYAKQLPRQQLQRTQINLSAKRKKSFKAQRGKKKNRNKDEQQSFHDKFRICDKEINYLYEINRGKFNPGVQKTYLYFKKQKQYIETLTQISKKYKYKTFDYPDLFTQFQLASKHHSFFHRLRNLLLYKPHVVSPSGDLALFSKMQRVKLAYLILGERIKVQNFHQINADLFALNDDYEKYGTVGDPTKDDGQFYYHSVDEKLKNIQPQHPPFCHSPYQKIQGGLYGTTLETAWRKFRVGQTNIKVLRGYLGEEQAYQIFIKIELLVFFFVASLIGITGQLVKHLIIKPAAANFYYAPEVGFYLTLLFAATIAFSVFMQLFNSSQQSYINDYQAKQCTKSFRLQYKGPYMRNLISDKSNQYPEKQVRLADRIKYMLSMLVVLAMLGLQIGFYYLIRWTILQLSFHIQQFDRSRFYMLYPSHLAGYSIYFLTNQVLQRTLIIWLFRWLTKFQNWPTKSKFENSVSSKMYLFGFGTELIGPIDLVFIQYSIKSYCHSYWCFRQIQAYTYARFFVLFALLLIQFARLIQNSRISEIDNPFEQQKEKPFTIPGKLRNYLTFVVKESKKSDPSPINLYDETLFLLHFSTFLIIFPLGAFVSYMTLLIIYNISRQSMLGNERRPISRSQKIIKYSTSTNILFHWMLFFNFSQLFILLEWAEYVMQKAVLFFVPNPTFSAMMVFKLIMIIILTLLYAFIGLMVRLLVRKTRNIMLQRKTIILNKFIQVKGYKAKQYKLHIKLPLPLITICRVVNKYRIFQEPKEEKPKKKKRAPTYYKR